MKYHLHAYVCGVGCVTEMHTEGMLDLFRVLVARPDGCRYAILSTVEGQVIAADLHDLQIEAKNLAMQVMNGYLPNTDSLELGAYTTHETVDAAIMSTTLTYEKEG